MGFLLDIIRDGHRREGMARPALTSPPPEVPSLRPEPGSGIEMPEAADARPASTAPPGGGSAAPIALRASALSDGPHADTPSPPTVVPTAPAALADSRRGDGEPGAGTASETVGTSPGRDSVGAPADAFPVEPSPIAPDPIAGPPRAYPPGPEQREAAGDPHLSPARRAEPPRQAPHGEGPARRSRQSAPGAPEAESTHPGLHAQIRTTTPPHARGEDSAAVEEASSGSAVAPTAVRLAEPGRLSPAPGFGAAPETTVAPVAVRYAGREPTGGGPSGVVPPAPIRRTSPSPSREPEGSRVQIGQVDVIVEAPPQPAPTPSSRLTATNLASRLYLRSV